MAKRRRAHAAPTSSPLDLAELGLALVAFLGVAFVALYFSSSVNRVFDVPKAHALKWLGCIGLAAWLLLAAVRGVRFEATRLFILPVLALVLAVGLSTITSIDPWLSFNGVYERQFGFQGYLACLGLFLAASAGLQGRAGAYLGLGFLAVLGGMVGAYARVQGLGFDPFGWFESPNDKVFSFLGNATFAGNSLALLFPLVLILAVVAVGKTIGGKDEEAGLPGRFAAVGAATVLVLGLQLSPTFFPTMKTGPYGLALALSALVPAVAAALGSWGPSATRSADPSTRRLADAVLAGAMLACVLGVLAGLLHTRTRGAWVASAAAIVGGLALLPNLFADEPRQLAVMRRTCWSALGVALVGGLLFTVFTDNLYARTIRSIPAAFDPESVKFGRGQGTRMYLWGESPRVLIHHDETLARMEQDLQLYEEKVAGAELEGVPLPELGPEDAPDGAWRSAAVWLTGIGIETYRYAFMSHKSKRLEALDPMTNHDNPHNNYLYILASLGLLGLGTYLWLLGTIVVRGWSGFTDASRSRSDRALAFGLLTSFMSYSVYSLAGFDSVACSVFLFFMLGAMAVLLVGDRPQEKRHLEDIVPGPKGSGGLVAAAAGLLCVVTAYRAQKVLHAEQAFVPSAQNRERSFSAMVERVKEAIRTNPGESYYRQNLGQLYMQQAVGALRQARQLQREGDRQQSRRYEEQAKVSLRDAEVALLSALPHAWAPENIFISAFQLYNQFGMSARAEDALIRTLEHSPHLPPIRASLAALQLQLGKTEDAKANCRWAVDVDPKNDRAHTVCAQVALQEDRLDDAEYHLKRALKFRPEDRAAQRLLQEVRARSGTVAAESG